jgi:hypothetical protein
MADEHDFIPKKKKNIRIFIRRKRLSSVVLRKSSLPHSKIVKELTSIIEKSLNINKKKSSTNKNVIVVNYKPVFIKSRQSKPIPTPVTLPSTTNNNQRCNLTTPSSGTASFPSKTNRTPNPQSVSFDVPDVEDPLMFIEMMYQQLFTDDGQLRSETEPEALANCFKQIVTHSRRNSMVHRDSISTNVHQQKRSSTSLSSSSRFIPSLYSEEEEEPDTLLQRSRTANTSRR